MNRQTRLTDQTSIKVVGAEDILPVAAEQIRNDDGGGLPANCFVVPMQILETPEPIPRHRARKS